MTSLAAFAVLASTGLLLSASPAVSQSKQPSTDDELLKKLQSNPVDDYDRELLGGAQGKPTKPEGELRDKLQRELGAAAKQEPDQTGTDKPMENVAQQMRIAQQRIVKQDSGPATQEIQKQITEQLQRMIEEARKSGRQSQSKEQSQNVASRTTIGQPDLKTKQKPGTGENTRGNPREASKDPRQGKPGKEEIEKMRRQLETQAWIHLPPRDREQMLQLPREEFLPKYELLIEDYFRRLADEKGTPDEDR